MKKFYSQYFRKPLNVFYSFLVIIGVFAGIYQDLIKDLFITKKIKNKNNIVIDRETTIFLISSLHELERNLKNLNTLSGVYNNRKYTQSVEKINYTKTYQFFTYYFDLISPLTYGEEKNLVRFLKEIKEKTYLLNSLDSKTDITNFNKSNYLSLDDIRLLTGFYIFYIDGIIKQYLPEEFSYTYDIGRKISYEQNDTLIMNVFTLESEPIYDYSTILGLID